jgi:hypothetical protein
MHKGAAVPAIRHLIAARKFVRTLPHLLMRHRRIQLWVTLTTCALVSFVYLQILGSQSPLN